MPESESEAFVPSVQLFIAATPESRGYDGMPYTLYRDGALIEQGVTEQGGKVTALCPTGTQYFRIELPGNIHLDFPMLEAFPEGAEEALYQARTKGIGPSSLRPLSKA
ncbi:MAG: hypothetical protein OIF57_07315 [Marinobacterium sp.]|nr:hypothetical protein [Marinobacterium sp.]